MIERLTIPGADGSPLAARLHRPPGKVRGYALFAHCFTCGKDIKAAGRISAALALHGIATLRFDFTGLGQSEGEFADTSFSSNVGDLVAVADYLREHHEAPKLLVGHSLGGAAVLLAAERISEVVGVATIGAPADPGHVRCLLVGAADEIEARGEAEVELAGRRFTIKKQFLDDLAAQQARKGIRNLGRALIVFHSPEDATVGIDNAREIYQAARHPKSFVSLDGADHLLTRAADAEYVACVLSAWAARYLPQEPEEAEVVPRGTVVVEAMEGLQVQARTGPHSWLGDEPPGIGNDTGPSPYDMVLAGLGACTVMTLRLYADRKSWPLEGVRVELTHGRIHADDCDDCDKATGKLDVIDKTVHIVGDLDDAQRARLHEISKRCPVHRTLENEIKIRSHDGA